MAGFDRLSLGYTKVSLLVYRFYQILPNCIRFNNRVILGVHVLGRVFVDFPGTRWDLPI